MILFNNYTQEERNLINYLLENGKDQKWEQLAEKFNVRADLQGKKRRVAVNDIWRRFLQKVEKHNLDLKIVKQTFKNGELLYETRKVVIPQEEFDSSQYEIEGFTTNPNGGAWKKYKKKAVEEKSMAFVFDKLFEKYSNYQFNYKYPSLPDPNKNIAVLNLYDAHLDKIPIKSSTGVSSSLEENLQTFKETIERILPYIIQNNPEYIVLPLGNDLFHTNFFNSNKTKKGTKVEYFTNPEEAYYAINDLVIETVLRLSSFTKVNVIMIKGNHDEDKITTLGYWLNRMFRSTERINVEFTRNQRKYIQYGENLIGFAHGDKEKFKMSQLPLLMAQEAKQYWGHTTYRKMFLGDLHHGFEYQFLKAKDQPGVEVEYLRSVGTTDTWHEDFGWIGVPKTAYLQIFDKYEGEFNRYKFNIK